MAIASYLEWRSPSHLAHTILLKDFMPFPIGQINRPKSVYISDDTGVLSAIAFPLKQGLTLLEQNYLQETVDLEISDAEKESIKALSKKISELPGQLMSDIDVGEKLLARLESGIADISNLEAIAILNDISEIKTFKLLVERKDRLKRSAQILLMMRRTEANTALGWDPTTWQLEDALNPSELPIQHANQISVLATLEAMGKAHYCISQTTDAEGNSIDVFYFTNKIYNEASEKFEKGVQPAKPTNKALREKAKN
jgi:hypothetical protein